MFAADTTTALLRTRSGPHFPVVSEDEGGGGGKLPCGLPRNSGIKLRIVTRGLIPTEFHKANRLCLQVPSCILHILELNPVL